MDLVTWSVNRISQLLNMDRLESYNFCKATCISWDIYCTCLQSTSYVSFHSSMLATSLWLYILQLSSAHMTVLQSFSHTRIVVLSPLKLIFFQWHINTPSKPPPNYILNWCVPDCIIWHMADGKWIQAGW